MVLTECKYVFLPGGPDYNELWGVPEDIINLCLESKKTIDFNKLVIYGCKYAHLGLPFEAIEKLLEQHITNKLLFSKEILEKRGINALRGLEDLERAITRMNQANINIGLEKTEYEIDVSEEINEYFIKVKIDEEIKKRKESKKAPQINPRFYTPDYAKHNSVPFDIWGGFYKN